VIARRVVAALGLAQLISWGATYYLIGGFGEQISADLGWGATSSTADSPRRCW
jgi:hypothetical protein